MKLDDLYLLRRLLREFEAEFGPPVLARVDDILHDHDPHIGQCCNYASRQAYGNCTRCGRKRPLQRGP